VANRKAKIPIAFWPLFSACCGLWVAVSLISHLGLSVSHLSFLWLLVFRGVCGCACALVCMQFLCFLGFYVLWSVQWLGHLLPPVFDWLQGFMCVCAQVSCSVISNWSLHDLFVEVCIVVLLSIIFNFLKFVCSWDTRLWIKSKNTIRSILIHHRQNPTEIIVCVQIGDNEMGGVCRIYCNGCIHFTRWNWREGTILEA
jgi:hypothetical protein